MKKLLFAAIALLVGLTSCDQKGYSIVGTVDSTFNLDGQMVYLQLSQDSILDSTEVKNGVFAFTGTSVDTAKLAYIVPTQSENSPRSLLVILEKGVITAKLGEEAAQGTALNNAAYEYYGKTGKLMESFNQKLEVVKADTAMSDSAKQTLIEEEYMKVSKEQTKISFDLFKEHTDDALGALMMLQIIRNESPESDIIAEARKMAAPIVLNNPMIAPRLKAIDMLFESQPGKKAKDFEGVDAEGNAVNLYKYVGQGNYALVDFWASWCGPCRREIPYIAKAYEKYASKGLQVVGIVVWDELEDHIKAASELNVVWPQIIDNTKEGATLYGVNGIPMIILIGPDGTIVERDLRGEKILEKLEGIYAAKK